MDALVTGGAGFIGSHLVDALVARGDRVRVLDDLSTGLRTNVNPNATLIEASVADADAVREAVAGCEVVFHLGALGSVTRSVTDPQTSNLVNVDGTLNVLTAARDAAVRRVVFASSSSVYGGAEQVPTPESAPLRPRSPYAITKLTGDWYTRVFAELYELETVVLRYFNVFGPRQRPDATYAAVIPLFAAAMLAEEQPVVHGDGTQSRDFTYVGDVVAANLAAAHAPAALASGHAFNVAPGAGTSLLELLDGLASRIGVAVDPVFVDPRPGDVHRSCADATAAREALGWAPTVSIEDGLARYVDWIRAATAG
ncbi:MAG: NAD-dependent epimerase/dehydratase family protein [Acidimicrobiia bacterium]|nr:NAD-dependent epimerase/dehydratase family protein [Acidimicrobiia bacterium]